MNEARYRDPEVGLWKLVGSQPGGKTITDSMIPNADHLPWLGAPGAYGRRTRGFLDEGATS